MRRWTPGAPLLKCYVIPTSWRDYLRRTILRWKYRLGFLAGLYIWLREVAFGVAQGGEREAQWDEERQHTDPAVHEGDTIWP